jgi:hypothetical protein
LDLVTQLTCLYNYIMHPSKTLPVVLAIVILLTGISAGPAFLQSNQDGQYFEDSGHWVRTPFLEFYRQAPDPLLLFGFPITEAFDHPVKQGIKVQFFQRARMEWDTNGTAGITLLPLGEYLYDSLQHGEKAGFAVNNGACRVFPTTNKPVCYAFLQFYDANQGSVYFGDPISDVEILDNRLVQYFKNARMEWRPENEPGQRVALTDIGRLNFDIAFGDATLTKPSVSSNIIGRPTRIQVYAFPDKTLITATARQKVFVIVRDQNNMPVEGALVMIEVQSPNGTIDKYRPDGPTNKDGFVEIGFNVTQLEPNQVVKVIARANVINGPDGNAETMFRIWW